MRHPISPTTQHHDLAALKKRLTIPAAWSLLSLSGQRWAHAAAAAQGPAGAAWANSPLAGSTKAWPAGMAMLKIQRTPEEADLEGLQP